MPLYEYRCRECDIRFEVLQRLSEGSEGLTCPKCGASRPEKQLSTFAATSSSASPLTSAAGCGKGGFT
jgi:putative FmdB family regulatory protein